MKKLFVLQELSDMTAIKAEVILTTFQSLELIQYRKGQHVIWIAISKRLEEGVSMLMLAN
jgi:hypothetical protein